MAEAVGTGKTVLVVDDHEPTRVTIARMLEAGGFTVRQATSADDALERLARESSEIDMVLSDVTMPGMSGIELQRRLRDANSQVPIIFITAHGDASLRDLAMKAGAAGFLNKPVRSDTLLKEIHAALENAARDRHPR